MSLNKNYTIYKIGDYILCDCPMNCGISGRIIRINHKSRYYELEPSGGAFFDTARIFTKLERVLK